MALADSILVHEVDYWWHKEGSEQGQLTLDNSADQFVFRVTGNEINEFCDYVLGFSKWDGTTLTRVLPEPHPFNEKWFAAEIPSKQGFGKYLDDFHEYYLVTVQFRPLPYAIIADGVQDEFERYTSRKWGFGTDTITRANTALFKFVNTDIVLNQPPVILDPFINYQMTWHQVPVNDGDGYLDQENQLIPIAGRILEHLGKVNSVPFDLYEFPAETVLFLGIDPQIRLPAIGSTNRRIYYDLTFNFLIRDRGLLSDLGLHAGHNSIFDIKNDRFNYVTYAKGSYPAGNINGGRFYQSSDLNLLFLKDS